MTSKRVMNGSWVPAVTVLLLAIIAAGSLRFSAAEQLAKSTKGAKPDGTGAVLVETVQLTRTASSAPAPDASRLASQAASTAEPTVIKPTQVAQKDVTPVVAAASGNASSTSVVGGGSGRKLMGLGGSCKVTIKNMCPSRKQFQVSWGGYTFNWNGIGSYGWRAMGWFNVNYGRSITLTGTQTMYLAFTRGIRLTRYVSGPVSFCVSSRPYDILDAEDEPYYYFLDSRNDVYYSSRCSAFPGGYIASNFYAFTTCGMTILVTGC